MSIGHALDNRNKNHGMEDSMDGRKRTRKVKSIHNAQESILAVYYCVIYCDKFFTKVLSKFFCLLLQSISIFLAMEKMLHFLSKE